MALPSKRNSSQSGPPSQLSTCPVWMGLFQQISAIFLGRAGAFFIFGCFCWCHFLHRFQIVFFNLLGPSPGTIVFHPPRHPKLVKMQRFSACFDHFGLFFFTVFMSFFFPPGGPGRGPFFSPLRSPPIWPKYILFQWFWTIWGTVFYR